MDYQFKEMEYEEDLFQKIINREFPTEIIFEDDSVFAFEWINPVAPTHILIIPKKKIETLNDYFVLRMPYTPSSSHSCSKSLTKMSGLNSDSS